MGSNDAANPTSTSSPGDPAPSALAGLALSALTGRGYRSAGPDSDGFEILGSVAFDAVLVRPVYNGRLRDLATRRVRYAWIGRYTSALLGAGLYTALVNVAGSPFGVIAARDVETASRAADDTTARLGRRDGGADG